ncbi:putative iron ion homeostasis-related protein [Dioszegia hungarica]|uniref:Iron ion homeostasis-related protein n=1 Tax=Dioszegia hungarica TaxID=4972 RepID=A0AA38LWF0_9TREE|nr:putative iron ion homeostasis-related protein [Dioszegia hungarica]KAI9637588.1 putative iron ion homeostasis-related protein [Dioszegia hungarica]
MASAPSSIMRSVIASSSRSILLSSRPAKVVVRSPALPLARSIHTSRPIAALGRAPVLRARPASGRNERRTMFIQTETTPNEASLKFIPGTPVTGGSTHEFLDLRSALPSPLATRLLTIDGLTEVFFGPDFVTCSKDESLAWSILKPEIFAVLMEHFSSGQPLFKDGQGEGGAEDTRVLDTDSEVVGMIKELLETRVRPAIQEDGGDIEYKGFIEDTGMVQLKLKGSCRGCSSSSVTLKNGIERMLMHYVPEVQAVEQVLDDEEIIALDEFAKFEARLEKKQAEGKKE